MKTRTLISSLVAAGAMVLASASLAGAAGAPQIISDFEDDTVGSTSPLGWTVMNEAIDLGVTEIAGCTSVDTSTYTTLRDIETLAPAGYDPNSRQDTYPTEWDEEPEFSVAVEDGSTIEDFVDWRTDETLAVLTRDGLVLGFSSSMEADNDPDDGFVMHGPAVYSDTFTSAYGRQLSFWWAASGEFDDYHVLGYLLNTATCEQTEVLDATGLFSLWQEAVVNVPEDGTFRFVFVAGTYDQSWGGGAGGRLWIDDIVEAESVNPPLPRTGASTSMVFLALMGVAFVASGALATRRAVRRG